MLKADRRQEKRDRIVHAAAKVFARAGYAGTVMADIAAEAGIGKGTLYEYFESKDELFFAVFTWYFEMMAGQSTVGIAALSAPVSDRLRAMLESAVDTALEWEELMPLFMEFWAASGASHQRDRFTAAFADMYRGFRDLISRLIQEGMRSGEFRQGLDPESIAAGLIGAVDGMMLQAWFDKDLDLPRISRDFLESMLAGLAQES